MTEGIFGIWNPTPNTLKCFEVMGDVLAKDNTQLELGIYTRRDGGIQSQYCFDMQRLLSDWQKQPLGDLSIAFFRSTPIGSVDLSHLIPRYSIGNIAVTYLGFIYNLPQIQDKLTCYGYQFDDNTRNVAETLCYLLDHYLEFNCLSPVEAMQVMMRELKGSFAFMALVAGGKWLLVGSRDYPLAIGKNNRTVYFATDTEILAHFSKSKFLISKKTKPSIFCATSFQKEILLPVS